YELRIEIIRNLLEQHQDYTNRNLVKLTLSSYLIFFLKLIATKMLSMH
ncbi:MAG: hypothetical protein RLZZ414_1869, partial [Bacteroidota bacterium]